MTRAINPEGPKGSPVGASVQSNPPSPNADMEALASRIGTEQGLYASYVRRILNALTPADRKLLAEADGTMRVVPVMQKDADGLIDFSAAARSVTWDWTPSYPVGSSKYWAELFENVRNQLFIAFAAGTDYTAAPQEEQSNG